MIAGLFLLLLGGMFTAQVARMKQASRDGHSRFLAALGFYALMSYQFMGGIQSFWIPIYFLSIFLFLKIDSRG